MLRASFRRVPAYCAVLLAFTAIACDNDPADPAADPEFDGTYAGTYTGSGGCQNETVEGGIVFTIVQTDLTLAVAYTIDPDVEGLSIFGGQAEIVDQSDRSFVGTITEPAVVSGDFTGELSTDDQRISGDVHGTATVLCSGVPQSVSFAVEYEGTRQGIQVQ